VCSTGHSASSSFPSENNRIRPKAPDPRARPVDVGRVGLADHAQLLPHAHGAGEDPTEAKEVFAVRRREELCDVDKSGPARHRAAWPAPPPSVCRPCSSSPPCLPRRPRGTVSGGSPCPRSRLRTWRDRRTCAVRPVAGGGRRRAARGRRRALVWVDVWWERASGVRAEEQGARPRVSPGGSGGGKGAGLGGSAHALEERLGVHVELALLEPDSHARKSRHDRLRRLAERELVQRHQHKVRQPARSPTAAPSCCACASTRRST
jgi:hypothetical protein